MPLGEPKDWLDEAYGGTQAFQPIITQTPTVVHYNNLQPVPLENQRWTSYVAELHNLRYLFAWGLITEREYIEKATSLARSIRSQLNLPVLGDRLQIGSLGGFVIVGTDEACT